MTRGNWTVTGLAALALLGALPTGALAQAPPASGSARGIFLAGSALGVSTEIEIERDGKRGIVPPTFEFRSGDKFWLLVTTNKTAYVYVLNRTMVGNPEGAASRGIKLMQAEDATRPPAPDAYTLVYPAPNTAPALVKAGATVRIPSSPTQFFAMDDVIGAEKVMVVAAQRPSDIAALFNPSTGKLARAGNTADSAGSVLGRLNTELARMADNAETEETPRSRGIAIKPLPAATPPLAGAPVKPVPIPNRDEKGPAVVAGGGVQGSGPAPVPTTTVVRNPSMPLLQELTLVHLAR